MSDVQTFFFQSADDADNAQRVRIIMRDDQPWFVAADVCRAIGIGNPTQASDILDEDERMTLSLTEGHSSRGGARAQVIISESGMWTLVLRSRDAIKPGTPAHRFRRWVTGEVLPSIRKNGGYIAPGVEVAPELPGMDPVVEDMQRLPANEQYVKLATISWALRVHGRAYAAHLWPKLGLPTANAPQRQADTTSGRWRACLDHLLAFTVNGVSVRDFVRDSDEKTNSGPHVNLGLRIWLVDDLPFLAVANNATALFVKTEWSGGRHVAALRAAPDARTGKPVRFGRHTHSPQQRCTLLPLWLLDSAEANHA